MHKANCIQTMTFSCDVSYEEFSKQIIEEFNVKEESLLMDELLFGFKNNDDEWLFVDETNIAKHIQNTMNCFILIYCGWLPTVPIIQNIACYDAVHTVVELVPIVLNTFEYHVVYATSGHICKVKQNENFDFIMELDLKQFLQYRISVRAKNVFGESEWCEAEEYRYMYSSTKQ